MKMLFIAVIFSISLFWVSLMWYNKGFKDGVESITGGVPLELWQSMQKDSPGQTFPAFRGKIDVGGKNEPGKRTNL